MEKEIKITIEGKKIKYNVNYIDGKERVFIKTFLNVNEAEGFIRRMVPLSWNEMTPPEEVNEFMAWMMEEKIMN